ncbi:MAG TPA: cation:proton antiporter, partial [Thermoplasmata archaeon]|nr:cation:proton antiporter [Thermoplasmata archaeon]
VGLAFGLSEFDSLFLGLAISVTSTVILAEVLEELGVLRDQEAGLVLGVTIVEDIVVVSILGVLQSLATSGRVSYLAIGVAVVLVIVFVGATLLLGSRIVPRAVDRVAETDRAGLLLLAVLGLAFGLSIVSSLIGISVATGAFLAGVLVAESRSQTKARELVVPLKELFGAIFFVAIGALMDFELLPGFVGLVVALLVSALVVKWVATYLSARALAISGPTAGRTALTVAGPRGELSLVVAKGGADVQATSAFVLPVVGAIVLVSSVLAPFLVRIAWRRERPAADPPSPPSTR